jgi:hypothetical protein
VKWDKRAVLPTPSGGSTQNTESNAAGDRDRSQKQKSKIQNPKIQTSPKSYL